MTVETGPIEALWLGILVAVHPCPLAANVVAISFLGRHVGSAWRTILAGLLYTVARAGTYLALSVVLIGSALWHQSMADFLQRSMNKILGPLLILVGMVLLDLIRFRTRGHEIGKRTQRRVERSGIWGAALLGVIFALSFCPPVAAVFFIRFIPLSIQHGSRFLLPALFGIGTGLPVFVFAILAAVSAQSVGKAFNRVAQVERWARRITGVVFVLAGIFYCLTFIFEVQWFGVLSSH